MANADTFNVYEKKAEFTMDVATCRIYFEVNDYGMVTHRVEASTSLWEVLARRFKNNYKFVADADWRYGAHILSVLDITLSSEFKGTVSIVGNYKSPAYERVRSLTPKILMALNRATTKWK